MRSAAAMGVCEIVVVGAKKLNSHGAHGTPGFLRFSHFNLLDDALTWALAPRPLLRRCARRAQRKACARSLLLRFDLFPLHILGGAFGSERFESARVKEGLHQHKK